MKKYFGIICLLATMTTSAFADTHIEAPAYRFQIQTTTVGLGDSAIIVKDDGIELAIKTFGWRSDLRDRYASALEGALNLAKKRNCIITLDSIAPKRDGMEDGATISFSVHTKTCEF